MGERFPPRGLEIKERAGGSLNPEKAVETADDADDADRQGLEVKRPRTSEVTPEPSMDSVVQPLHLRNRRHLRLNELPVLGPSFKPGSRFKLEPSIFKLLAPSP